jgi:hypothetical protein
MSYSPYQRPSWRSILLRLSFVLLLGVGIFKLIDTHLPWVAEQGPAAMGQFASQQDEEVRTLHKDEQEFFCQLDAPFKEVYRIRRSWTVHEYRSGNVEINESSDTTLVAIISQDRPCPQRMEDVE